MGDQAFGPLQEATTDDLISEVLRRFRTAVFIGQRDTDTTTTNTCFRSTVNATTAIGLCHVAIDILLGEIQSRRKP